MNLTTHQSTESMAPKPLLRLLPAPLPDAELWFDDMCEQFRHRPMLAVFADQLNEDFERTSGMVKTDPLAYKTAADSLTEALADFARESEQLNPLAGSAVEQYITSLTLAISSQIELYRHLAQKVA